MRYYRIILSVSIFALFVSLFSVSSKILATELTTDLPNPEVQTATTTQTPPPETAENKNIIDIVLNWLKNIIGNTVVVKRTITTDDEKNRQYGNASDTEKFGDYTTRGYNDKDRQDMSNNYISRYVGNYPTVENITTKTERNNCSTDVTLEELAKYLVDKKPDIFSNLSSEQLDNFKQKTTDVVLSNSNDCYNTTYDNFYINSPDDTVDNAGALDYFIPSEQQNRGSEIGTSKAEKITNQFKNQFCPDGQQCDFNQLTPNDWQK